VRIFLFLFFILTEVTTNLYAGIASGPAIHDRNVIPLSRPLTELKTDSPTQVVDPITGLGLEWEALPNTKFNMLWAHKLGNNPGRRTDNSDFDRTSIKDLIRFGFTQQF
jgi:hypothetical protein